MNIPNVVGFFKDNANEKGSFEGPDGTWSYQICSEIGGKPLKGKPKLKWRCILSTPKGVFIGVAKGKSRALERALDKANKKFEPPKR